MKHKVVTNNRNKNRYIFTIAHRAVDIRKKGSNRKSRERPNLKMRYECSAILCLGCCYIGEQLLHLEEDATVDGLQAYVRLLITSSVCFYLFP